MKIRCAVIGLGYWGPNLARNVQSAKSTELISLCDANSERLKLFASDYPNVKLLSDCNEVLDDVSLDAVLIATPVATHFSIVMAALRSGKHVFVEKPLTTSVEEAKILIEEAKSRGLVLMVDHTFIYTPAVRRIRMMIEEGVIGTPYYYDSVRINLGIFQRDVNVIWDLAVHDFSIIDYLFDEKPHAISAIAVAHLPGQPENMAYINCFFNSGFIAHIHVNWLAPVKVRQTIIGGSNKMVVCNDLEPDEKIKVYDRGLNQKIIDPAMQLGYRMGDMWAPKLNQGEALLSAVEHFCDCIKKGAEPITGGGSSLRVMSMLNAATQSVINSGSQHKI